MLSEAADASRHLRPLGTTARLAAATALIVVAIRDEVTPADWIGALLVLPAFAIVLDHVLGRGALAVSQATGRLRSAEARSWAVHVSGLVLILAIAIGLTFATAIDAPAIWLFFGGSLVLAAIRGDAGCEALAIPNAVAGRRARTGCIAFAAIDRLESREVRCQT